MPSQPRLVIRCFAASDEGLVDEWPLAVDDATLHALVPTVAAHRTEIHEVTPEIAAKLMGRAVEEYPEAVAYFVEPETLQVSDE